MEKEDVKIGQKVSFYYSGAKRNSAMDMLFKGEARTVHGVVYKIHRVNIEVEERDKDGFYLWYKKPTDLTLEGN